MQEFHTNFADPQRRIQISATLCSQTPKPDSVRPDASTLKAGLGDETPQLAFGINAPHQAPEDSAIDEQV
jgi:hypothetical protein